MLVVFLTSERNVSSVIFFLKLVFFFFLVREPKFFLGLSGFHQVSSPFRLDAFLTFKSQNIGRGY